MNDLDAVDHAEADPGGMLAVVEDSASQWERAVAGVHAVPIPDVDGQRLRAVVVAGMGGSGITADVAAALGDAVGTTPVIPSKGYTLPAFADERTLVVGVSYSGTTEETLAALDDAGRRGAPRYAVTTGGHLAAMAEDEGFPWAQVAVDDRCEGARQPRANLPRLTAPLLAVLDGLGVVPGLADDLGTVAGHVAALAERWHHTVATEANDVKRAALALREAVPVFYGGRGLPAVVALRGKCQVNENAERPAFHHELPELDHNEIMGWTAHEDGRRAFAIVELRSPADEHPRVGARADLTAAIAAPGVAGRTVVPLDGPTTLARFAGGVLFVDLVSVHLAFLGGVDPTRVGAIDELKHRLAELDG